MFTTPCVSVNNDVRQYHHQHQDYYLEQTAVVSGNSNVIFVITLTIIVIIIISNVIFVITVTIIVMAKLHPLLKSFVLPHSFYSFLTDPV